MANYRCPGMNLANFKPDDVQARKCLGCDGELEFWKDDVKLTCPSCGHVNFNPGLGSTCLVWCKSAAQCVGSDDIKEWIARKEAMTPKQPGDGNEGD